MTARVAIYARYSSDRQNERSIEDQVGVCERHAAAKGWTVVDVFSDAAISGSTMVRRPGLQAAIAAAEAGEYDILLAEDEDRLARNLEHQAHVFNRLRDFGVAIATLASDRIGILEVGLKGVMNELYLEALSAKTKRGMAANADKGLATGSRLYGYRSRPGGQVEIVEAEAEVVRRIWREYGEGATAREIAARLNLEGVKSPRGGPWNASTINGSVQRGNGILNSEIYAGVKTYGRVVEKKNRTTGRRRVVCAPREQWKRVDVPHLRIVDAATVAAVRARQAASAHATRSERAHKPHILSGLLRCRCGASYTVYNRDRLACAAAREKGPAVCTNRRLVKRPLVEQRVLEGLKDRLLHPEAVAAYVAEYRERRRRRNADVEARTRPLRQRLAMLDRKAGRLVDELADTVRGTPEALQLRQRLAEAAGEAEEVRTQVAAEEAAAAAAASAPIELLPRSAEHFRRRVEDLHHALERATKSQSPLDKRELDLVRQLVERIDILPTTDDRAAPVDIVIHGRIVDLIETGERLVLPASARGRGQVVVGGRYSCHPTWGTFAVRVRL